MGKLVSLVGQRFGRLLVKEFSGLDASGRSLWLCVCNDGNEIVAKSGLLRRGSTQSCGCLRKEVVVANGRRGATKITGERNGGFKHGATANNSITSEYQSWRSMISRCTNPRTINYLYYGGRGITICERWQGEHGFENFLADMGPRPEGQTIDRKEVKGNYEPGNCRWATPKEQIDNRRNSKCKEPIAA
jgi:hypothetical protein